MCSQPLASNNGYCDDSPTYVCLLALGWRLALNMYAQPSRHQSTATANTGTSDVQRVPEKQEMSAPGHKGEVRRTAGLTTTVNDVATPCNSHQVVMSLVTMAWQFEPAQAGWCHAYSGQLAVLVLSVKPARSVTLPSVGILLRFPCATPPPSEHTELRMLPVGEGGSFSGTPPVVAHVLGPGPAVLMGAVPWLLRGAGASRPNTSTGSPPRCNAGREKGQQVRIGPCAAVLTAH